ncbi:hypothetical protein VPH35_058857 [Triticum aestivum]
MAMEWRPLPRGVSCPSRRQGVSSLTTWRRVTGELRHRRQHGGESLASCVTGDEHEDESPASCGTGGKHAAVSVPRRRARGESVEGVDLIEASGDDDNRRDKMALAVIYVFHRRNRRPWASREE